VRHDVGRVLAYAACGDLYRLWPPTHTYVVIVRDGATGVNIFHAPATSVKFDKHLYKYYRF